MIVQAAGIAAIGDGMEVEIEGLRFREQERRQLGDPGGEELFLVAALGAIGVIAGEGFLGENVETGEDSQSFIEVEVVDVAMALLVKEFQDQEAE